MHLTRLFQCSEPTETRHQQLCAGRWWPALDCRETTALTGANEMTRLQASEANGWLLRLPLQDARVSAVEPIVGADGVDVADDNVDVDIVMADGSVHHRVFMTPQNASTLLAKWRTTGECGHGAFLAVDDAVLLPNLSEHAIIAAVTAMLEEGEFEE